MFNDEGVKTWHLEGRRFEETKVVMVNTFMDLKSYGIYALSDSSDISRRAHIEPQR